MRPQVDQSTENTSPRATHASAPKTSPQRALTATYMTSAEAVTDGIVAVPL